MMILWISCMFLVTVCSAQNNLFSQANAGGGSASASGGQFNQLPRAPFSGVSASSSAGPPGASASAQVITPAAYPACLTSNPDDAVKSVSPLAYSMLEGSFTNPFLKSFFNTSFDTSGFYDVIYNEVKETLSKGKSQILAGSLSILFDAALPKLTPLLNAISLTNALIEIHEEAIVITDDKEDYIESLLTSISKAVSGSDGSAKAQAQAVVSGLLEYLEHVNLLTYSKLNEFISILAGNYRLAIYSTCKPSTFGAIPKSR